MAGSTDAAVARTASSSATTPGRWNCQKYGSASDPLRQSDLSNLASQYACGKRFAFEKAEDAAGQTRTRSVLHYKTALGTVSHESIRRYLTAAPDRILAGQFPAPEAVRKVVDIELEATLQREGASSIDWRGENPNDELSDVVHMVLGALRVTHRVAEKIVLCEAPFRAPIQGPGGNQTYWTTGTVDLVYVPRGQPDAIGLLDWKTGAERPERVVLDHGYQLGVYANALEVGTFFPGEEREVVIGIYPVELSIAHLRDAVPYTKSGSKEVKRSEDAEFYGAPTGTKIKYVAGDQRGPILYPSHRSRGEMGRLSASVATIVGAVRKRVFVEFIGDGCTRCPFATRCLAEGFDLPAQERAALEDALAGVDRVHLNTLSDFAA